MKTLSPANPIHSLAVVREALDELAKDIYREIVRRLHSDIGVNPRTGTNTLIGSELEKSIEVYTNETSDGLAFSIAEHWEYVVLGWHHTGRFTGTKMQFLDNLLKWIRRKNIHFEGRTENQTVYLIYRSINERLIAPRPFINYDPNGDPSIILPFLDEYFSNWADELFNEIVQQLDAA